jgi:hypothetical protein
MGNEFFVLARSMQMKFYFSQVNLYVQVLNRLVLVFHVQYKFTGIFSLLLQSVVFFFIDVRFE